MSGKLIMTKGLPSCGKSTWAAEMLKKDEFNPGPNAHELVVVTKDDIRAELNRKDWNYDVEKEVLRIRDFRVSQALSKGLKVISADTNLAPKHEARLREIAKKYKADFEIKDFTDTAIDVCIQRDKGREEKVGEKVIRDMAEQFLRETLPELAAPGRAKGPQLYLDLDGLFADFDGFIEKEFGIEGNRENERPDFWDIVRGYRGRLYFDMGPLPDHDKLWKALKRFNPIILTGCPWSIPTAADDKREWVAKYVDPKVHVICCKSRNKCLYMRKGDVIVDDWPKYRDLIEGVGVEFIQHDPKKWEASVRQVEEVLLGKSK